jgi:hypothetical protein
MVTKRLLRFNWFGEWAASAYCIFFSFVNTGRPGWAHFLLYSLFCKHSRQSRTVKQNGSETRASEAFFTRLEATGANSRAKSCQ